jgi:RecB family exonuclease
LWLGGICDAVAELKDGTLAIIDFKSSKEAYFSQFVQCALYDLQLQNGGYDQDGNKILEPIKVNSYIVCPFGAENFAPRQETNIKLQSVAKAAIEIYRLQSSFENNGK